MKQKSGPVKQPAEAVVKDLRRATRRQFSAEEKICIVLEGLRGEESFAETPARPSSLVNRQQSACPAEGAHSKRTSKIGQPPILAAPLEISERAAKWEQYN